MLEDYSILIVEDELLIATHLKAIIESFKCKKIELAHNKQMALACLEKFKPDLILLDINLEKKHDGIEVAAHINQTLKTPFIFITAYSDSLTLAKAINQFPAAFITKPFKQVDVLAAIQLIFVNNEKLKKGFLKFKYGNEWVSLNVNTISHVESSNNYIILFTPNKKYTLRHSLHWAEECLPNNIFVRIHRTYLININHVSHLKENQIQISNYTLPVSRSFKNNLIEKMQFKAK